MCQKSPIFGALYRSFTDDKQTFCQRCAPKCDLAKKEALMVIFSPECLIPIAFDKRR